MTTPRVKPQIKLVAKYLFNNEDGSKVWVKVGDVSLWVSEGKITNGTFRDYSSGRTLRLFPDDYVKEESTVVTVVEVKA